MPFFSESVTHISYPASPIPPISYPAICQPTISSIISTAAPCVHLNFRQTSHTKMMKENKIRILELEFGHFHDVDYIVFYCMKLTRPQISIFIHFRQFCTRTIQMSFPITKPIDTSAKKNLSKCFFLFPATPLLLGIENGIVTKSTLSKCGVFRFAWMIGYFLDFHTRVGV